MPEERDRAAWMTGLRRSVSRIPANDGEESQGSGRWSCLNVM